MEANRIERPNISQNVAADLREMIFLGELAAGEQINEVHLAARLGVSRTPLREALSSLVAEKAVDLVPRRGFFVRQLTIDEAKEIYAIRPLLEPEALRLAGLPAAEVLDSLDALNAQFSDAPDARTAISIDDSWHVKLLSGCHNRTLVDLLMHIIRRSHRYELAVMGQREVLESSARKHGEITAALRAGDLEGGCALLRDNLSGLEPVLRWLEGSDR